MFPIVQSIHLIGIALLVGSIVLIDLWLLGYALQRYDVSEIRDRLAPWRLAGMAITLVTGPILFISDVTRYSHNPAFLLKMAVLLPALSFRPERRGKWAAVVSLALWTCVVIGGRAIADFDI